VAVVALQLLLMERERRQLQQKLSQLSNRVDETTAVFVQQLAHGTAPPSIDEILRRDRPSPRAAIQSCNAPPDSCRTTFKWKN
jgi:Asp-tRNA(Asn)/Glu-tRNA(Gln) amidotransferase C subunit